MHMQVRKKTRMGSEEEIYETELAQLFSEEDAVRVFFVRLDEELNKVNQFYKKQEGEFVERGESLKKQLEILHDLKQIISERRRKSDLPSNPSNTEVFTRSSTMNSIYYSAGHCSLLYFFISILLGKMFGDFDETNSEVSEMDEEIITTLEKNGINFVNSSTMTKTKKGKPKMAKKIDVLTTTSTKAITAITSMLWEELVNNPTGDFIHKRKIQCAEKMIRSAFVELYRGLGLLKTYSTLNMVAFAKILKKFDKVSCQKASASYLKEVKKSHFVSSDKVVRQIDEVESIFTKHFANNERKKAMKFLRPQQHKDSHMTTFLVGLSTGCFVSLLCVYAILAHLCGIYSPSKEPAYMKIVYPVFRYQVHMLPIIPFQHFLLIN
ncbi:putative SPX domain-containing protein [Lupinus albus]|uniref:Putative SPX domain-containing protein n=1 Tax=Lupinus albus TaxID=3870 RepID=A0A6A4QFT8_LUPAL|nr:putative SPX domain-containing protein [Lupinus albus]